MSAGQAEDNPEGQKQKVVVYSQKRAHSTRNLMEIPNPFEKFEKVEF